MYGSSISYLLLTQTRSPEKAYQKGLSPYIISLSTAAKKARISHCIMTFPQRGGDKGKFLLKRGSKISKILTTWFMDAPIQNIPLPYL